MVSCPICGINLKNEEVFGHLESPCTGDMNKARAGFPVPSECSSCERSPTPRCVASDSEVTCPACGQAILLNSLNDHLDNGCPSAPGGCDDASAISVSLGHGNAESHGVRNTGVLPLCSWRCRKNRAVGNDFLSCIVGMPLDRLAAEMRCSLCLDLFDDQHSLPCQHSFCHECIMGCFRVTRCMQCPLCKAPVWKRQVTPNHTLAGIVEAFREYSGR